MEKVAYPLARLWIVFLSPEIVRPVENFQGIVAVSLLLKQRRDVKWEHIHQAAAVIPRFVEIKAPV